ncbi:TIGR02594 family protein [Mesorhizobium sp. CN2-181]|uniref:TIGR02594 family protein n=1 Tax=Mesorhizobium yinganensis TaxID=3157707 RepID=UPI0032B750FF
MTSELKSVKNRNIPTSGIGERWLPVMEASWKPIAALAIPIVVAFAPNFGSLLTNDRKVDSIIVEKSLEILAKEPQSEGDKAVRDWAIANLETFSGVAFSAAARDALRNEPGPISQTAINPFPVTPQEVEEALVAAKAVNNDKLLKFAVQEIGINESDAKGRSRIAQYNQSAGFNFDPSTPWNSQFLNWIVKTAGYEGTNDARSRSWASWGKDSQEEVGENIPGCIAVFWRTRPEDWAGMVGIYLGTEDGGRMRVIGGNFYNAVDATWIKSSQLLSCRLANDWVGPAQ